ncbi:isochorismate synthase [Cytobacillus kochii]|uniref:isochorismate synthase n=1 Tax=Cytobacillus kochii TaxID=859143 RepID=UPI001CD2C382|nr:isochorismate synthase [Cytobacillus kochii]MCA1028804.1 isochorismate synthase [Cytobacillus kochii]MDM5208935.1 isochorismate synthase [Cytobacillus kochii]
MFTLQHTEFKEGFIEALSKAQRTNHDILFSEVCEIDCIDPLAFFGAGKKTELGDRFFWTGSDNEVVITGVGINYLFQSDQTTDRFFYVQKKWQSLLDDAIIHNSYSIDAIGPTLFGGFTFDPLKEKTKLWSQYKHTDFHLPQYMCTIAGGRAFLTTNMLVHPNDREERIEDMLEERRQLLQNAKILPTRINNKVIAQHEVASGEWKKAVAQVVDEMRKNVIQKVVLARETRLTFAHPVQIESVLQNLLDKQKNSFIFAFESGSDCFIGATPERLVKKQGHTLYTTCLAGSMKRGETKEEDDALGKELLQDEKNLQEHQYVVDMIRQAMEMVGTEVELPEGPQLLKLRDIQHLYTPVIAAASKEGSLLAIIEKLHPTPALGGVPTEKAIEVIRDLEILDRGLYGSPIGWLDYQGNGDFAVALRSGLIQDNEASIFAGCGVVKDSEVESEYQETKIKFRPMLSALGGELK